METIYVVRVLDEVILYYLTLSIFSYVSPAVKQGLRVNIDKIKKNSYISFVNV
jgi:hypothetical protein